MFLRKRVRLISMFLLFCLLAWYSRSYLRKNGEELLVSVWNHTFHRFGPDCIYWITMRLAAWISIYLYLLRLESGFSVYLFLRQRSYGKVFTGTYIGCIRIAVFYYGVGTLIMTVCHWAALPDIDAVSLLQQTGLPLILAEEGLEALSFCLAAYAVHGLFRKAEAGFLAVLAGRLVLNFATGGARPGLSVQLAVNLVMAGLVFLMAFRDFTEKFIDG